MSKKSVPTIFFVKVWAFTGSTFAVKRYISDQWAYASRFCRALNSSCMTTANFALSKLSSLNFTIWKSISSSLFPSGRSALAGMVGEHGGESIYHQFNLLRNRFSSIPEAASRSGLSHVRRASSDGLSFSSWDSQKKAKKGLKMASLELMILHGMTVFNFSSKKKIGVPGLKIW